MPKKHQTIRPDWNRFTENLAQVLGDLDPGEGLTISSRSANAYVQFAVNEDRSIRAEATSNNLFLGLETPVDCRRLATLAVATLQSVYRIGQLSELSYHSFHADGRQIRLPTLGLDPIDAPFAALIRPTPRPVARRRPKLPPPLELPPMIQKAADDLLMRFDGETRIAGGRGFKPLTAWLEENYDEAGLGEWDHDTPTPIIPTNEAHQLCDTALGEELDEYLDESNTTDEMRIAHLDRHLAGLLNLTIEPDADRHPACGFVVIRSALGRQAVLGYGVRGHSYSGIEIEWYGIFREPQDIWRHLRRRGWLFDPKDLAKLSRAAKLKLWDR